MIAVIISYNYLTKTILEVTIMENNTNSNNKNLISDAVVIEFLHTVRDVLITFIKEHYANHPKRLTDKEEQ